MAGLALAERLLWRRIVRQLLRLGDLDKDDLHAARQILSSQLHVLAEDVVAAVEYQRSEAQILDARLGRRYDPGLALQEATVRAKKAKLDQKGHRIEFMPGQFTTIDTKLTPAQEKALAYQGQQAYKKVREL